MIRVFVLAGLSALAFTTSAWAVPASAVPEPSSWALMLTGVGVLGFALRRKKAAVAV